MSNNKPKIIAENTGGKIIPPIPAGSYAARCFSMIQLGLIEESVTFEGTTEKKIRKRVRISWEIPEHKVTWDEKKGPQPYVISREMTLSLHENAALLKHLESWRGKKFTEDEKVNFDIAKLVEKPCLMTIIHNEVNGKIYANISSLAPPMKEKPCAPQVNKKQVLTQQNPDQWDQEVFENQPDFVQAKIKSSAEYKARMSSNANDGPFETEEEDDLPF